MSHVHIPIVHSVLINTCQIHHRTYHAFQQLYAYSVYWQVVWMQNYVEHWMRTKVSMCMHVCYIMKMAT